MNRPLGRQFGDVAAEMEAANEVTSGGDPRLFKIRSHGPGNTYEKWRENETPHGGVVPAHRSEELLQAHNPRRLPRKTPLPFTGDVEVGGEFSDFKYPGGSAESEFVLGRETYEEASRKNPLGGDFPSRVNPQLQYEDLSWNTRDASDLPHYVSSVEAITPEGSAVGRVEYEKDLAGDVRVNTAEISPLYRGRGFSSKAIPDFMERFTGRGGVYTDMFTPEGRQAFGRKGIPTQERYGRADSPAGISDEDREAQRRKFMKRKRKNTLGSQFQGSEQLRFDI